MQGKRKFQWQTLGPLCAHRVHLCLDGLCQCLWVWHLSYKL